MLSHANVMANIAQMQAHCHDEVTRGDRVLLVLPLYHIYAMVVSFGLSLCRQATVHLLPKFEPSSFLQVLQDLSAAPLLRVLLGILRDVSFRVCMSGAGWFGHGSRSVPCRCHATLRAAKRCGSSS